MSGRAVTGRRAAAATGAHALRHLALMPALLAAACVMYDREYYVGHDRLDIARVVRADGASETYVLEVGRPDGDASLVVRTEYDRERAFLGLQVTELDRATAEPRGVDPYRGLLVTGTYPRSAAGDAGVTAGDVVLSVGGEAVVYREQLPKAEARLRPEQPVPVRVLRGREEKELTVVPKVLKERVVEPEPIELERTVGRRPYCGVVLRGIPHVWCQRMFGDDRNAVVISAVDVGSPAWVAGFRAGDLIERVDGAPVGDVEQLGEMIHTRGEIRGSVRLQVRRGLDDRFDATVALDDYTARCEVWLPLLFHVKDGAREDSWTVGPFGLLVGNRSTYVDDPPGRTAATRSEFDALLGLVHVESGPQRSSLRLLWIIDIPL